MHQYIKDFFTWSKKERIGVIVLSTILLGLFLSNFFFDRWFIPEQDGWNADSLRYYSLILDSLEKEVDNQQSFKNKNVKFPQKILSEKPEVKYYQFDPNKNKMNDWIALGFSQKQAEIILKYKNAIGGFKTKEDLGRCFVINSNKMTELTPYIRIDTSLLIKKKPDISIFPTANRSNSKTETENTIVVELNSADSIELLNIRGIGPYFASKIVAYKNNLGGYKHKEQLLEIWNFDSSRFTQVNEQVRIDTNLIVKININHADADAFKVHPYIRWNLANAIVKYRGQHGNYTSLNELKNVALMTDSVFNKISSYMMVD